MTLEIGSLWPLCCNYL